MRPGCRLASRRRSRLRRSARCGEERSGHQGRRETEGMPLAVLILSGLSLIVVIIVGWRTVVLGERSAKASEQSAPASQKASEVTEKTAEASAQAAVATERSVVASELAAALAAKDARVPRIEAALDVVLEMRETSTGQLRTHPVEWPPVFHSPESIARVDLCRRRSVRLVSFAAECGMDSYVRKLSTAGTTWVSGELDECDQRIEGGR